MALPISRSEARVRRESGYSLLMVVFMVATMLILAATAMPNLLTQGRREREIETIWRGKQYERAIGLYFTKFGRYPTKIDDLTKQTNGVRFLRQAYTDPLNKTDGSWRFIYVGPNGQLIGSLRPISLQPSLMNTQATPTATAPGVGTQPGANSGTSPGGTTGGAAPGLGQSAQPTAGGLAPVDLLESQPQPLSGTVIGGNIIGVGSKIKQSSLIVYQGGDTYEQWEFIWNPTQQGGIPGQQPAANPATSSGQQPPQQQQQQLFNLTNPQTPAGPAPQPQN